VVFAADEDGKVVALSADKGKRLWRVDVDKPLSAGPGLAGDMVLVGTHDGEVLALDRRDGSQRWAIQLSGEVLAPPGGDGNIVVVRCFDGRIYGLAADSGQRLWVQQTAVPTLSLRGVGGPVIVAGRVLVGLDNGKVLAIDAVTGQPVWESVVSVPVGRTELERLVDVDAEPLEIDGTVYAVSYAGDMTAFDLARGQTLWRAEVASITGIAGFLDWLFVSSRDGAVIAIDRNNGDILWEQKALLYRELSRPVIHNGLVAVADLDGYVHWLSPQNGQILGRDRPVKERVSTPPVVADRQLYLRADDGRLTAVVVKTR
ncbi:MAG: outer membrane protein assembly factor BamB, partial [Nevskiales bacterium]